MAGSASVPLSRTYGEGNRTFSSLVLRVPRWQDYVDLGDVEEWQPVDDPRAESPRYILIKHNDVVASYAERCVQAPVLAPDLVTLDLADTLAVHGAIRDFFINARPSKSPPTGSYGDTAKGSTRSGG